MFNDISSALFNTFFGKTCYCTLSFYDNFASIVKATLGNDAGLVGAALLHKTMH